MNSNYKDRLVKLLDGKRLILASNRGPFSYQRNEDGKLVKSRGGGGLVSALLSLLNDVEVVWFSVAMSNEDKQIGLNGHPIGPDKKSLQKFVSINKHTFSKYYDVMCNELFWFIQHGLWDESIESTLNASLKDAYESYKVVNKKFAKAISVELEKEKESVVLLQDYHLYLAAKYIERSENVSLSHFTHIPWPTPKSIAVFDKNILLEIVEGLLANDLVIFHCDNYASNFIRLCNMLGFDVDNRKKIVKFGKKYVPVRAYPVSVDAVSLGVESCSDEVKVYEEELKTDEQLILRADRIDPSKNIIRGFIAYDKLLEMYPKLKEKVVFLAYLYESRTSLTKYKDYVNEITAITSNINKKYSTGTWRPIKLRLADNYQQTLAAYKHYDVLLVNSVADGMNLVAKEGALLNRKDGVLVLSNKAGAYNELKDFCIGIDPYDIKGTAQSLKNALDMAQKERQMRSGLMKDIITGNNSSKWLFKQLNSLLKQKSAKQFLL